MIAAPHSVSMGSSRGRIVAPFGVAAALAVLVASVATLLLVPRHSRPVAAADVGTTAPGFQLRDTAGRTVSLADHLGRVVVLFFNSAGNRAGGAYDARVDQLARRYASDSRVAFLAVDSIPVDGDRAVTAAFSPLERSFPTLLDGRSAVAARYSAAGASPFVVIIDPRGLVRYRGLFDDNPDVAFTMHNFCADVVRDLLAGTPSDAIASTLVKARMEDGR